MFYALLIRSIFSTIAKGLFPHLEAYGAYGKDLFLEAYWVDKDFFHTLRRIDHAIRIF